MSTRAEAKTKLCKTMGIVLAVRYNKHMQLVGLLSWWYSGGIKRAFAKVAARFAALLDYFSIDLLARTLFAPFRQISAGRVDGSFETQLRAFVDRLVSRVIGSIVRTIVIVVGCMAIIVQAVMSIVFICFWLVMPIIPIVGLVLMLVGWIPWTLNL